MRILDTFRPSQVQKQVLAKVAAAATPTTAADSISIGSNTVAARDTLIKLGLVAVSAGEASLTQHGTQVATAENIIDETGDLTEEGKILASTTEKQPTPSPTTPQPPQMEAFQTIKSLLG